MSAFLLVAIFITASLSLVSYVYCWMDIRGGRPHIISLRQITNIMDREEINRQLGPPQPGYFYRLSPDMLHYIVKRRRWFFWRECAADLTCLLGASHYMNADPASASVRLFILLAVLCQAVNFIWSVSQIRKWSAQIREEIENSED